MFVFSIFNCFNYLLFGSGTGDVDDGDEAAGRQTKDLGNELGRSLNLYSSKVGKRVATSSLLAAQISINKSINNCESCTECVQLAANAPPPVAQLQSSPSFSFSSPTVRSSFIRIFQLTFMRRNFPVAARRVLLWIRNRFPAVRRNATAFIDGTFNIIFAPIV